MARTTSLRRMRSAGLIFCPSGTFPYMWIIMQKHAYIWNKRHLKFKSKLTVIKAASFVLWFYCVVIVLSENGAEAWQGGIGHCSCHNETNVRQKTADFFLNFCEYSSFPDVRGGGRVQEVHRVTSGREHTLYPVQERRETRSKWRSSLVFTMRRKK